MIQTNGETTELRSDYIVNGLADKLITSLQGQYSRIKRKEEEKKDNCNLLLAKKYDAMQRKFKKVAVYLVTASNKERELIINKYSTLYRENVRNIKADKALVTNFSDSATYEIN